MGFIDKVVKFIAMKFWPWFKEFVWPFIKDHIKEMIFFVIGKMKDMFKEWFQEKTQTRQQEAEQKAQTADKQANDSSNMNEAEKYRAIAHIWREVAEQFRRDNEDLKRKLDEFDADAKMKAAAMVQKMDLDVDFTKKQPVLKIGEEVRKLPALPE